MDKKGSTIMEAAVILPLVIVSAVVVVVILSFLVKEIATETRLHNTVVITMGRETKTCISKTGKLYSTATKGVHKGRRSWNVSEPLSLTFRMTLQGRISGVKDSSVYEVNEKKYIRNVDLIRGFGDGNEKQAEK